MAASFVGTPANLAFKMDSGELTGAGRTAYKTVSLGQIKSAATAEKLAAIAAKMKNVLPWPVETMTFRQNLTLVED